MSEPCSNPYSNNLCSNTENNYVIRKRLQILRRAIGAILDSYCDELELKIIAEQAMQEYKKVGRK